MLSKKKRKVVVSGKRFLKKSLTQKRHTGTSFKVHKYLLTLHLVDKICCELVQNRRQKQDFIAVKYKRTAKKREKACWPKTEHSKDERIQPKKNNLKNKGG